MNANPCHYFALLAQSSVDITSGGTWAGAGVLVGVLGWLLFWHLPAKDKQLKEFMEAKDKHVADLMTTFKIVTDGLVTTFRTEGTENRRLAEQESKYEREQCQAQFRQMIDVVLAAQAATMKTVEHVGDLVENHHKAAIAWMEDIKARTK